MIMSDILSRRNPRIVFAASLHDKKARDASGFFCFEGMTLLEELYSKGRRASELFALGRVL